jgi:hypothetical protein
MPIIQLPPTLSAQETVSTSSTLRQRSPFLYTAILAVAARIYPRHSARFKPPDDVAALPSHVPSALRQLAYSHVAATILRKQQNFGDLQSILISSVWGLLGQGKGPDPWLLTGIVQRLAHRLDLSRASMSPIIRHVVEGGKAALAALSEKESETLHKLMSHWRACLACY